ncbi:hypothetical protein Poli38472_011856 [Pythium oligandrum]|uniref:Uncharacterized protein n=1 Tax=Pythium oligandrum TaxID=41045 RepID=A0A8K1C8R0_PYTOL|nr:hypothetical protein Poli38472_011856 [Pythium oligandrum]|eukprot:TMW58268.1 hypothetical protein Poli38472_011856 [Pythium oligandrum]
MMTTEMTLLATDTATDETLRDALAFVDDYAPSGLEIDGSDDLQDLPDVSNEEVERLLADLESSSSPRSDSSEQTASTATTSSTVASEGRRRRVTARQQLIALQLTAEELEHVLKELKKTKRHPDDAMWERIAVKQRKERERAENENARLRAMLAEHVDTVKYLEHGLFKKRSHVDTQETTTSTHPDEPIKRARSSNPSKLLDSKEAAAQMDATAMEMYRDVDKVFADARFQSPGHERRRMMELRRDEASGGTMAETFETRTLPFGFRQTSDVLFDMAVHHPDKQRIILKEAFDAEEEAISRVSERWIQLPTGGKALMRITARGRRFMETSRAIHINHMLIEPVQVGDKALSGVRLRTCLWDLLYEVPPTKGNARTTMKLSYGMVTPEVFRDDLPDEELKQAMALLSRFMQIKGQKTSEAKNQLLENRLVEGFAAMGLNNDENKSKQPVETSKTAKSV